MSCPYGLQLPITVSASAREVIILLDCEYALVTGVLTAIFFLGAFAQSQKAPITFVMSVRLPLDALQ
jgi:hypothetical protein